MSISERINPDNLNIHQFQEASEANKPEVSFDVDRDLPPEFKHDVISDLNSNINTEPSFCQKFANINILWPNEPLDNRRFSDEKFLSYLDILMDEGVPLTILSYASNLIRTRPSINFGTFKEKLVSLAETLIRDLKGSRSYEHLLDAIYCLKILDPSRKINITEEDILALKNTVEKDISDRLLRLYMMEELRFIDPNYRPKLTYDKWEYLRNQLPLVDTDEGVGLAVTMKILSAYKVEITSPGVVDIQMYPPKDVNTPTPPIPETRKF